MTTPCFEIIVYKVAGTTTADLERTRAQNRVKSFPGFLSWTPFSGIETDVDRVDLVAWATLEDAQAAARRVGNNPEFAAFRHTVRNIETMGHYIAGATVPPAAISASGVELGRFRLKEGVREEDMRAAYTIMVSSHLRRQAGWCAQHLIKLKDGVFVDLALAENPQYAEEICSSWHGNADCEAFLALIEPISMEFGTILETSADNA